MTLLLDLLTEKPHKVKVMRKLHLPFLLLSTINFKRSICFHSLREVRKLLRLAWTVTIKHVYREANFSADALASLGYEYCQGLS